MAAIRCGLSTLTNFLSQKTSFVAPGFQQIRHKYINRWMIRDHKRRKIVEQYAPLRLRILSLKRNNVLPVEIRELASKALEKEIPRQACLRQLTYRCILTSRPRGVVARWRVSRIVFRDLADYNKLSGVQRAIW